MSAAELVFAPMRSMRRAALAWAFAIALLIVATVAFWPAFKGSTALNDVLNQLPSGLVDALGLQDFGSPAGYLRGNLYELLIPLVAAVAAILLANGTTASDEEAGRMEMVLSQPVRRTSVFVGRAVAVLVWLVIIAIVVLAAQLASDAVFDLEIDTGRLISTVALSFLLGAFFGGLAFSVAGLTARPGVVLGVCLSVAIFGYLIAALFPLSDALAGFARVSPWDWAFAGDPLGTATELWRYGALAVPTLLLVALGVFGFARRDINAA